jgi:flagellar motor protein MotB
MMMTTIGGGWARRAPGMAVLAGLLFAAAGCANQVLKDENNLLRAQLVAMRQDKAAVDEKLREAETGLREVSRLLAEARAGRERAEKELADSRARLQQGVASVERETAERIRSLAENEQALIREAEKLRDQVASLEIKVLEAEANAKEGADALAAVEAELDKVLGKLLEAEQIVAALTADKQALEKSVAELKEAGDKAAARAATLESELRQTSDALAARQSELKTATDRIAALEKAEADRKAAPATGPGKASPERTAAATAAAREKLRKAIDAGSARVEAGDGEVIITLQASALFLSGLIQLSDSGKALLAATEEAIAATGYRAIRVTGHADNTPPGRNSPYPDNWEVGAARAAEVVRNLAARPGIRANALIAQSRSDRDPVASNDTPEGRARNRRVVLAIELEPGG